MKQDDIDMLTEEERVVLADSFKSGETTRRIKTVVWSTVVVLVAVVLFAFSGFGVILLGGLAAAVMIVSAVEKISYQRKMLWHESLIRKLVGRIERLEGVPITPDDAERSRVLDPERESVVHPTPSREPASAGASPTLR